MSKPTLNGNMIYLGHFPERAPTSHPSYLSYRHVNPVTHSIQKHLPCEDVNDIIHGYRRSDFSTEALVEDYHRGDVPKISIKKDEHYLRALEECTRRFKPKNKCRPAHLNSVTRYPWKWQVSAEAPFSANPRMKEYIDKKFNKGLIPDHRLTFSNLKDEIFEFAKTRLHRIKAGAKKDKFGEDLRYWNHAHARSHLVKATDPDKIRMVFGVPKMTVIAECMMLWQYINTLLTPEGPMLWGYETLKGGWYGLYNWIYSSDSKPRTFLAFDWKQFDKRVQFEQIDDAHKILRSFLDFENGYVPTKLHPTSNVTPERLENLWNWTCNAVKTTPEVLPTGDCYQRSHAGLPSGAFQTQLLDSIVNMIMLLTVMSRMGLDIQKAKIKVQGDDSIIGLLENIHPMAHEAFKQTFADYANEYFGSILNTKKSEMSNTLNRLPVLGFTNISGYPYREQNQLLASLLYPERKSDENKLMARCIGIAYANCGNHHNVFKICEEIYNYLKSKGFSPNAAGLPDMFRLGITSLQIGIKPTEPLVFPSFYDTIKYLMQVPQFSEDVKRRHWPPDLFEIE
uniref:RdRp n=1 Tax=Hubei partiti-like virus 25 TaxID=1923032 RepID=A0A1L3KLE4_9VIRU|nr:RdRp [Hubei partiti-like virus 25]